MPAQIRKYMRGHLCMTTRAMGWAHLENGDLIQAADREGFEVLITADSKMYHEQGHLQRSLGLVVLTRQKLKHIEPNMDLIRAAVERSVPGGYELVVIPASEPAER